MLYILFSIVLFSLILLAEGFIKNITTVPLKWTNRSLN